MAKAGKVTVEIRGMDEALATLRRLQGALTGDTLERALHAGALPVQNAAKEKAPYKTGNLRRSIHTETTAKSRTAAEVSVGTDLIYAAIHEFGGVITPKTARALVFEIDGQWVSAQRVVIPARPYLRPALEENTDAATREVGAVLLAAVGGVALG